LKEKPLIKNKKKKKKGEKLDKKKTLNRKSRGGTSDEELQKMYIKNKKEFEGGEPCIPNFKHLNFHNYI